MKTKSIALFGIFFMMLPSTSSAACDSLQTIDWLLGKWHARAGDSKAVEEWLQVSTSTFEGMGRTVSATGDIQNDEVLRLVYLRNNVYYLADVAHNPMPIAFKASICSQQEVRFENLDHDFPNVIHYVRHANGYDVSVENTQGKGFTLTFTQ